jgi:hypothetical protein
VQYNCRVQDENKVVVKRPAHVEGEEENHPRELFSFLSASSFWTGQTLSNKSMIDQQSIPRFPAAKTSSMTQVAILRVK